MPFSQFLKSLEVLLGITEVKSGYFIPILFALLIIHYIGKTESILCENNETTARFQNTSVCIDVLVISITLARHRFHLSYTSWRIRILLL